MAQPSEEAPTFPTVLPDVPYVPYVHVPPPSLNPPPRFLKKRPIAALHEDFPPEPEPYPDKYKPHPTDHLPVWPTNANDRWDPVTGHAWPCCCQRCINLPWKNPPPIVVPAINAAQDRTELSFLEIFSDSLTFLLILLLSQILLFKDDQK